jgi:hypothetical protein
MLADECSASLAGRRASRSDADDSIALARITSGRGSRCR